MTLNNAGIGRETWKGMAEPPGLCDRLYAIAVSFECVLIADVCPSSCCWYLWLSASLRCNRGNNVQLSIPSSPMVDLREGRKEKREGKVRDFSDKKWIEKKGIFFPLLPPDRPTGRLLPTNKPVPQSWCSHRSCFCWSWGAEAAASRVSGLTRSHMNQTGWVRERRRSYSTDQRRKRMYDSILPVFW